MSLRDVIAQRIAQEGPLPFAEFMALALYDPEHGYYASAAHRSGRAGDFYTSVDVGSLFGELLAEQIDEMYRLVRDRRGGGLDTFDIVEAGAGRGQLTRDVLDAAAAQYPDLYEAVRVTLVELSPVARAAHTAVLGPHVQKLTGSAATLPSRIHGVILANELLDALPVHPLMMTQEGLREVYVDLADGMLVERLGPLSEPARAHVARRAIMLDVGARAEVCPAARLWIDDAARQLEQGFLLLIDYGHEATELYSPTHAAGTLASYRRHRVSASGDRTGGRAPWLEAPGTEDITAHVDLTMVRDAAEASGLRTLGVVDQSYFLLGLGAADLADEATHLDAVKRRLGLKMLLMPGGLGSTHKVMIFGKNIGAPELRGCSFGRRVT